MVAKVLCFFRENSVITHGQEQIAVRGLRNTTTEMIAGRQGPVLAEDHLGAVEPRRPRFGELCPCQRGASAAPGWLSEAEIDRPVLGEAAVERDIVQAALAAGKDLWQAGKWAR